MDRATFSSCLLVLYSVLFTTPSGVSAQGPVLSLKLQTTTGVLLPYEPLIVHISLANQTPDHTFSVYKEWASMLFFEVRCDRQGEFTPLQKWWRPAITIIPGPPFDLKTR